MALLLSDGSYLLLQQGGAPVGKLLLKGDPGAIYHSVAPPTRTANFGEGTTAVNWIAPLDPAERKIYTVNCATELSALGDRISLVTVTLSGLAALAGLQIYGVTNDETQVSIWFQIDPDDQGRAGWNPPGETHLVTVNVTSTNGHVFERTIALRVMQLGYGL